MKIWLSVYRDGKVVGLVEANSLEQAESLVGRLALAQRSGRIVGRDETGQEYRLRPDGKFVAVAPSASVFDLPTSTPTQPARR